MQTEHMDTAQPSELALPQELQSHNDAQVLLLQDYVGKLSHTQRTLEATYASLQQTELLAGVIHEQDCRAIRTAWLLPKQSTHPCRSPSQCNRTCSYKPTATAHTSECPIPPYRGPQHSWHKLPVQNLGWTFRWWNWSLSRELNARMPVPMRLS